MSLLIVDDDEAMRETLSDILNEKGYRTSTARTGAEALTLAERHVYNISLIDIRLPDTSGLELLRTFKEKYPERMNIMITGYASLDNAVDALNKGADAYVMKPLNHPELFKKITACLKQQKEERNISPQKITNIVEEAQQKLWEERQQIWQTRKQQNKPT